MITLRRVTLRRALVVWQRPNLLLLDERSSRRLVDARFARVN
jgi:hypothetical protein